MSEFECKPQAVKPEWIDYSGHMNIGYYLLAFEAAAVDFFRHLDLSGEYRARTDHSLFALETHIVFLREVQKGAPLRMTAQLVGHDEKRARAFYRMYNGREGYLAATNEVMYLHMDLNKRKSAPFLPESLARIQARWAIDKASPMPDQAGRGIGFPVKKAVV